MKERFKTRHHLRVLLYQYFLVTILLAIVFACYMWGNPMTELLDAIGWTFFLTSCLTHSAILMLIPLLVIGIPLTLCRIPAKISGSIISIIHAFVLVGVFINKFVYAIYRFHINAFIIKMFTGPAGGDIFVFGAETYIQIAFYVFVLIVASFFILWLAFQLDRLEFHYLSVSALIAIVGSTLVSQGIHVYSGMHKMRSVMECKEVIPYYFPIRMNSLFRDLGMTSDEAIEAANYEESTTVFLNYPLKPIVCEEPDTLMNIIWICIDSWNYRTLQSDCTPNIYRLSERGQRFTNHFSGANETLYGTFSLFTALPSYYWQSFEYGSVQPVFTSQLVKHHYLLDTYPSATLLYPPIAKMYYCGVDVRKETPGETTYERDCNLTKLFLEKLQKPQLQEPFFSFLFYDGCHSMYLPEEKTHRFTPSWKTPRYMDLKNDLDPTPYFNLYRNSVFVIDSLVGKVLSALEDRGLMDRTLIVVTGDHGQEFNENKRNYWGHSGNYSRAQIGTPLVLYYPGIQPTEIRYRTTHYDIVPTIMDKVLGVKNPPEDYSMGHLLDDSCSRNWLYVGKVLDWAFIIDDDVIVEKQGTGVVDIFDKHMKPLPDYRLDTKQLHEALTTLGRFNKK
jgi:hypothetical protein